MADIESLELQITGDSKSAKDGLDALIATLDTLKLKTQGGAGLSAIAKPISNIAAASKNLTGSEGAKIKSLAEGLNALSTLGNLKLSSSVAHQIDAMAKATANLNGVDTTKLTDLSTSLQSFSGMGKTNMGSILNQLERIPNVIAELDKADLAGFSTKIRQIAADMKPLADEMQKVANGFSAFPAQIQSFVTASSGVPAANNKSALSFANLATKVTAALYTFKRLARVVASWIGSASEHNEDLNLFSVSMGEYAGAAADYARSLTDVLGIDFGDWLKNQGTFMTLAKGFGIAGDRAATMSEQLTQLGFDIASFRNISVEESMQKLMSGFSGELEPLRNLGYDLSKAKLESVALSLGIDKTFDSMTQAEKASLRYHAIMTQLPWVHGDMARTLDEPANQMRVLRAQINEASKALGNLFIPILNKVLPYLIAFAKVIRIVANAIASLFKISLPEVDTTIEDAGVGAGNLSENLDEASGNASKLRKTLLGIDELNVMSDPSSGGSGIDIGAGGGFDFPLVTYDPLKELAEGVTKRIDGIVEKMKEWLGLTEDITTWSDFFDTRLSNILETVACIAVGFGAWKLSTGFLKVLEELKKIKGKNFNISFGVIGAIAFMADLDELKKYFEDFVENGPTFYNVSGMLSEVVGLIGDAMLMLGRTEIAGPLKIIQGVGEIVSAISSIAENGLDIQNAMDVVRGISNIGLGIGVMTGNFALIGGSLALQGVTSIITELSENWEAIKNGDWSGVDKATLVIGAIEVIGGIVTAFGVLEKLKKATNLGGAAKTMTEVTTTATTVSSTTSTLTSKLGTLAKDLGMGIVIIAEVAAAAIIIAGAIWALGLELEQVGIAWEPVIANGETVAIAMGIGTGILAGVGVLTAALGKTGKTLIVDIGIGIAILAEIGVAALLFIAEIWAVGKGLDEIGKAWQSVLDNGDTIAKGIGIGTGLLVGIGVVTAALGAATVASAGALPLAIGIGTLLLIELAAAFVVFTDSLIEVANKLSNDLSPALTRLNDKLPGLSEDMSNFVDFMKEFAGHVVAYTEASAISGLAGTIDKIIGWFTDDPIDKLTKDVNKIYTQTSNLNDKLDVAVPELEEACGLLKKYRKFLTELEELTNVDVSLSTGMFVNMKEVGEKLVTGFVAGIQAKSANFSAAAKTLVDGFKNTLNTNANTTQSSMTSWASKVVTWFTSASYGSINQNTFKKYGQEIVSGFAAGVTGNRSTATNAVSGIASEIKKSFSDSVSYGNTLGTTFTNIWSKVRSGASEAWAGIKSVFNQAGTYFKTTFQNAWSGVASVFSVNGSAFNNITNAIVSAFRNIVNDLIRGINSVMKNPFFTINTAIRKLKYTNFQGSYPFIDLKEVVVPQIPYLASGGIVKKSGQLFVANEAGPELVASVGRKTAVMNNDQIVDSVSRGVYDAVVAAMGSSRGDQVVEAKVNDKVLFEVMVSRARQETVRTGHNPLLGGV